MTDDLTRSVVRSAAPQEHLTADELARLTGAVNAAAASGPSASAAPSEMHRTAQPAAARRAQMGSFRPAPPAGTRTGRAMYLGGLIATTAVCVALMLVFTLRGGSERVWMAGSDESDPGSKMARTNRNSPADVYANPHANTNGGGITILPSNNRGSIGRTPGTDPGFATRLDAARQRLRAGRQGWEVADIELTVGEPRQVAMFYMSTLQEQDRLESYSLAGERHVPQTDGGDHRLLFYNVTPYDLQLGAPHVAPRELFRFEFAPSRTDHIAWCDEQLAAIPDDDPNAGLRMTIVDLRSRLTQAASVYELLSLDRVPPTDPDYQRFAPH